MPKPLPFEFIFDEFADIEYRTNPMFGCLAIYVGEKIVLILRDKKPAEYDNGIWIATTQEHHASLKEDFPTMRSIRVFGPGVTGWQNLPVTSDDFERDARKLCRFVRKGDERIGKVPAGKKKRIGAKPKPDHGRTQPKGDSPLRDARRAGSSRMKKK